MTTRFTDNGDGTVTDTQTGLTWQRRDDGQRRTWPAAQDYAAALDLAGGGWRVPNVQELVAIVDYGLHGPAIDPEAFPGTASSYYWSSSSYADNTTLAWIVNFYYGYVYYNVKTSYYYVRCVR